MSISKTRIFFLPYITHHFRNPTSTPVNEKKTENLILLKMKLLFFVSQENRHAKIEKHLLRKCLANVAIIHISVPYMHLQILIGP